MELYMYIYNCQSSILNIKTKVQAGPLVGNGLWIVRWPVGCLMVEGRQQSACGDGRNKGCLMGLTLTFTYRNWIILLFKNPIRVDWGEDGLGKKLFVGNMSESEWKANMSCWLDLCGNYASQRYRWSYKRCASLMVVHI